MKKIIILVFLILMNASSYAQNILEALQLKSDSIGEYLIGELMASDTIVDLRNAYYEEYLSSEVGPKTIVRQAALFQNQDASRTLGISITKYDFVCFYSQTNFYEISKSKDRIDPILNGEILPDLELIEFVEGTSIRSILNKYLPEIQENYLGPNASIDKVLSEIYEIKYLLPQSGTTIIATLEVCDYIPTNEVTISPADWSIIEKDFLSIELTYDKRQKKFLRATH